MIIQHNMLAMNNLIVGKQLQKSKAKNMERLSSGYRINRAADDAANMAISEKMHSRIRALARCQQNIEEGISLAQTADGALQEVNNMLNRAAELCVQAANDTNTTEDRSKIAAEITQIYDDMDRVFTTTEFNTMKIFRHDGDNYYGPEAEYLYHESVTELPPGELHSWGTGMFPTKQFNLAKPATKATATVTLGANVNINDAKSLDGTSFYIKREGTTYKIEFGQDSIHPSDSYNIYINTKNISSVQDAFNSVKNKSQLNSFIDSVSVSGKQLNFTFKTPDETKSIHYKNDTNGDGIRETNVTAYETIQNGAKNNGISIYSGNTLNPVEDNPTAALTFAQTITQSLVIDPPMTDLSAFRNNAKYNSLIIQPGMEIKFSELGLDSITDANDLRQAIVQKINNKNDPNISASFNHTNKEIIITLSNLDANIPLTSAYIKESTSEIDTIDAINDIPKILVDDFVFSIQSTTATSESFSKHTFQMPTFDDKSKIYTLKVNDSNYVVYDRNTYKDYKIDSSSSYIDFSQFNSSMEDTFLDILDYEYDNDKGYNITENNGEITMTSKQLGFNDIPIIEAHKPSRFELLDMSEPITELNGNQYFDREYEVSLDFSSVITNGTVNTSALNGKGFLLNNKYYQFKDGSNSHEKYNSETTWIDISGVIDVIDLSNAIQHDIAKKETNITTDTSGTTIKISGVKATNYSSGSSYTNFLDGGPTGTFSSSAISAGGEATKNPQTEIDFSMYDMDNLDELYGTGFRITCATCPGEFINVMFCHDKSELTYPKDFKYTDTNGNTSIIRNYMVELKDVTHGSQIAANIADQLKNDLDHFTEVKVSDTNPSVLIAQDKRSLDQSGRGQVLAGVYTNFLYHVLPEKLPNLGDKVGGGRKDTDAYYAYCMIYAGDTKEKPYIPVHLPHFSVENLKLEYPKEPWDSYEEITNVMNRSRNAAEVVSMARSKIGADQNRLEHAFDYAANAEEQLAAANSRIEDTDMAEAVTAQAKLTILSNTQEAMLSQIIDLPERILPLLQQ